ncbi:MAG: polymer-forming cytoskeletal protein [bacterium]|nr:polymer-forming cytoskeletal protein [bacterium]MDT8367364.1 polymer-forming cytoskeletal protein [bacterium]
MIKKEPTVARGEIKAFLGEGTDFKGILTFEGTVRVDGQLEGEVYTKDTLIVGESAVVAAEINVHTIVISGIVRGNINATGKIEVHRPGKLFGNVKTPSLFIEEGVIFEGNCAMAYDASGEKKVSPIVVQHDAEGQEAEDRKAAAKTD